jgi:signal peptidase II
LVDQSGKYIALKFFRNNYINEVKRGIITFKIVKNEGAALGILEKRKNLLLLANVIIMLVVVYYYIDFIRNGMGFIFVVPILFILGGGLSNLIDRLRMKCVVDFFMFNIKNSPVFNIADLFIFIGAVMLQMVIILNT